MSEAILITGRTRGGFSGGTLASAAGLIAAAQSDRATRRLLADPYNLSPARDQEGGPARQPDMAWAARDPLSGRRVGPFFGDPGALGGAAGAGGAGRGADPGDGARGGAAGAAARAAVPLRGGDGRVAAHAAERVERVYSRDAEPAAGAFGV